MMRSAFGKEFFRSILRSPGRFLALLLIVGLGVGFYAGLRMTASDMKINADHYYDDTQLMDVRVVSTMGLSEADIEALKALESTEYVEAAYETDVLASIGSASYTIRVHSLPPQSYEDTSAEGSDYLNQLILSEGRLPESSGECVICMDTVMNEPVSLGDVVSVTSGVSDLDDVLAVRTYTIVGLAYSPYYVCSANMGISTLGSGWVEQFMYILPEDFAADLPYTEAFLTTRGARDERFNTDEYQSLVDTAMNEISGIKAEREQARYDEIRGDAQADLDNARAEYETERADAENQLADARARLDTAANDISASEQELANGEARWQSGTAELATERQQAENQLATAEATLTANQAEYDAGRAEWNAAAETIAQARSDCEEGRQALDAAEAEWQAQSDALAAQAAQLDAAIAALKAQIDALDPETQAAQIAALEAQVAALKTQREEQITPAEAQLAAARTQLDAQSAALEDAQAQIDEYDAQGVQLDEAAAALESGWANLAAERAQATSQLANGQAQLDAARAELDNGYAELDTGRAEYESGLEEYETERADADAQFAEAEEKLDQAQSDIDAIKMPEWLVMDRMKNIGVASFDADADRVNNIASVFPFIFFLVAALVSLTSMTRMVEEERILIGTYKALGYSRVQITSKYVLYALIAGGIGSALGIAILSYVLPVTIMIAYKIIYYVPIVEVPVDIPITVLSVGLGLGLTLAATLFAATTTLRERPASLMLPRAPKPGKRILLERIPFLWRRLSFSWKVTFRNIFRDKRRFVMTVIGIAGCTALLLTGFGLRDAINDIIDIEYDELVLYNVTITEKDDISEDDEAAIDALINNQDYIEASTRVHVNNMLASGPAASDKQVSLVVPADPQALMDLRVFRTRVGHKPIVLNENSVVIDEKLANEIGVSVGDEVSVAEQDKMGNATSSQYNFTITDIVENYVYSYLYVGAHAYEEAFGETPSYNTLYIRSTLDEQAQNNFDEQLTDIEGVKTVGYNDEIISSYRTMLKSVDMIVIVLVVSAAALAFIVLYNLVNINIAERVREIATLKVLGFTRRETFAYIFREIALLATMGCLVGLFIGIFLEGFVVTTAEVDQVMFGRTIHPLSYLFSLLLTLVFSIIVMMAMRHKLARINMVESLKSNE